MTQSVREKTLALIPARGGSKSVPGKNIIRLFGKPMIAWTIEHSLSSKRIGRTIVTTDDHQIADIARSYGAEVPFIRPQEYSGDLSPDIDFHRHALEFLYDHEGFVPDMVVNLRPTTPARVPATIDRAIEIFSANPAADSLRSVHLASETPYKMWRIGDDGYMRSIAALPDIREPYNQPRQVLPLVYWQDGYIDITRPRVIFELNSTTGKNVLPFIVDEPAIDIDYPEALSAAEAQLRERTAAALSAGIASHDIRHPS